MSKSNDLGIGFFPGWNHPTEADVNAQKINDGIETACLEIIDRINRTKETATDKELIDLSVCLSGLITAWNIASLRAGYSAYTPMTTGFCATEGGAS